MARTWAATPSAPVPYQASRCGEANRQLSRWSERNPDYWDGAAVAGTQAVVFRPITDANARVNEMLSGGIDLMVEVPPSIGGDQFVEDDGLSPWHEQAGPHLWFLILNLREEGPFTDKCVCARRPELCHRQGKPWSAMCCRARPAVAASPIPPAFAWAYNESLEPYPLRSGAGQGPDGRGRLWQMAPRLTFLCHRRRLGHARPGRRWVPRSRPIWPSRRH